jgi:hypothetical protein
MKELLVGSVFFGGSQNDNDLWFHLQDEFLKKTTESFDRVVALQSYRRRVPPDIKVISRSWQKFRSGRESHARNLARLLKYFREHKDEYANFLILDSDAFPVKQGWLPHLHKIMGNKVAAAAVRLENFSPFPHPCAFFVNKEGLFSKWLNFRVAKRPHINGHKIGEDTGCSIPMDKCFPLVRTNVINLHPLFAAIYGNMFYHHGTGSRLNLNMFVTKGYYQSVNAPMPSPRILLSKLKDDPIDFIEKLMCRKLGYRI